MDVNSLQFTGSKCLRKDINIYERTSNNQNEQPWQWQAGRAQQINKTLNQKLILYFLWHSPLEEFPLDDRRHATPQANRPKAGWANKNCS